MKDVVESQIKWAVGKGVKSIYGGTIGLLDFNVSDFIDPHIQDHNFIWKFDLHQLMIQSTS